MVFTFSYSQNSLLYLRGHIWPMMQCRIGKMDGLGSVFTSHSSELSWPCFQKPTPIAQSVVLGTWEQEVAGLIPASANILSGDWWSHCDRIHSSLTAVHCFNNGYVEKQPVAWKEYCAAYWLKELWENMDRCTGCRDITEILLKTVLNTIQSINLVLQKFLKKEAFKSNITTDLLSHLIG